MEEEDEAKQQPNSGAVVGEHVNERTGSQQGVTTKREYGPGLLS